jgi:hypothetical protein
VHSSNTDSARSSSSRPGPRRTPGSDGTSARHRYPRRSLGTQSAARTTWGWRPGRFCMPWPGAGWLGPHAYRRPHVEGSAGGGSDGCGSAGRARRRRICTSR